MDGSGYMTLLDQENQQELSYIKSSMTSQSPYLIDASTKAVIISFNLNYSPQNVNCTGTIVFEFSPMGTFIVHRVKVDLFVLDHMTNRRFLLAFELSLLVFNKVMLFLFFN